MKAVLKVTFREMSFSYSMIAKLYDKPFIIKNTIEIAKYN